MNDKLILGNLEKAHVVLNRMMYTSIKLGCDDENKQLKKDAAKLKALANKLDSLINDDEIDDLL